MSQAGNGSDATSSTALVTTEHSALSGGRCRGLLFVVVVAEHEGRHRRPQGLIKVGNVGKEHPRTLALRLQVLFHRTAMSLRALFSRSADPDGELKGSFYVECAVTPGFVVRLSIASAPKSRTST